jgi:hypothetical protein
MPNVGSNDFKAARGANDFVSGIPLGKDGTTGGPNNDGWKYGIAVYAHNGTDWVEVWNARPQMVSSTIAATSATVLSFTGTADPNNFLTTASFELREVGGSYTTSNTTTTNLGNNIDGAVGYAVTATVADTYKNWEVRAKGVNTAGTDYGSVLTLDCRNPTSFATYTDGTAYYDGGDCKTRRLKKDRTYTKTGCFAYFVAAGAQNDAADTCASYTSACYEDGVAYSNTSNPCGGCGYYTTSGTTYARKAAVVGPCDGTLTVANANGACREGDAWVNNNGTPSTIVIGGVTFEWTSNYYGTPMGYWAYVYDECPSGYLQIWEIGYCAWNTDVKYLTDLGCQLYKP